MESGQQSGTFFDRLQNSYEDMSSSYRKIADYISENVDEVILSSAGRVAGQACVSESAVVRFAQFLGYSGFPDLKRELIQFYREQMTPSKKFQGYLQSIRNERHFYSQIALQEIEHLQHSINTIDDDSLDRAAELIIRSNHRYVYATAGSNDAMASYMSFRLNRFRLRSTAVLDTGIKIFERFTQFTTDDFIIHYSFYKPRSDHMTLMDFLKKRNIPNLLITDSLIPDMVENADIVLFARRGPFGVFHSLIIPMAITNALIVAVAQKLGDSAIDALEDLSAIRQVYSYDALTSTRQ